MRKNSGWFMALVFVLTSAVYAADVTLYQDDFSGSASTQLYGLAPDIRPGTEVWNSATNLYADGHATSGANTRAAFLPFVMEQGKIYTFTADVTLNDPNPASNTWAMIGIRTNNSLTLSSTITAGPAFFLIRRNGALGSSNTGNTSTTTTDVGVATSMKLGIIVDTTATNANDWTVSFTTNGGVFGAANQPLPNTLVSGGTYNWAIGVQSGVAATFDNLLVMVASPGAARLSIFVISSTGVLLLCRGCSSSAGKRNRRFLRRSKPAE